MRTAHLLIVIAVLAIVPIFAGCPSSSAPGGDIITGDTDTVGTEPEILCSLRTNSGFVAWGPPAELSLTPNDEPASYAASAGLQFDFQATTQGVEQGQPIRLYFNGSEQASVSVTVDDDNVGTGLLINTTLPPGVTTVRLETENQAGVVAGCEDTAITIESDQCGVLLEPSADSCLTQDSDPSATGFQQTFTVTNTNGNCDTALLRYDLGGGELTTDPVELDGNGQASITITLSSSEAVDGENATVTAVISATGAPDRTGESATVTYIADNTTPTLALVTPTSTALAFHDDEDNNTDGLQVTFSGTVTGLDANAGNSISVTVDGNPVASLTPTGTEEPLTWQTVITFDESKSYTIELVAMDDCGNSDAVAQEYAVQSGPPVIAISAPTTGDTLWAKDDADPSTELEYETTFTVSAGGLLPGATLIVRCGKDEIGAPDPTDVGSLTITEISETNEYAVDAVLNVDANGTTQVCHISDGAAIETVSASISVTATLPAPLLNIVSPANETTTNQNTVVISGAAAHLNGIAGLATLTNEAGNTVYEDKDVSPPIQNDGFSWGVPLSDSGAVIPDGVYTIQLDAVDGLANHAGDQANSLALLTITLDTTAPTVSIFEPSVATLDASNDTSTDPGLQISVSVLVNDAGNEAGNEVCLEVNGENAVCGTVAPGSTQITFEQVTMQPGSNSITATATDAAGNTSTQTTISPTWISIAPRVFITQPQENLTTALNTVDISVLVETSDGAPLAGAAVTLLIDGDGDNGLQGSDQGAGVYTFAGVSIPSGGAHQFIAQADDGSETGYSAPRTITLKEDEPSIGFIAPTGGETLNKSSSACAPGSVQCNLTAICETKNVGNGSPATLTYDCGAGDQTLNGVVINNQVVFAGAVLSNNSTCTLTCAVTDLAGLPASAGPITVTVDRTAPMFSLFTKPGTSSLIFSNDEDPVTPGLQYSMAVTLTGVETGQAVNVSVSGTGFSTFSVSSTVAFDIPDGTYQTITLPQATIPQGVVTLQATTMDAAGNSSAPLSKQVSVISEEPLVRLTLPIYVAPSSCTDGGNECGAGAVCASGQCAIAWSSNSPRLVQVIASGIPASTQNLRICSDNPAAGGGNACATSGYSEVATATMSGNVESIFLNALADGLHTLIAEAKVSEGVWESSTNAPQVSDQSRRILSDLTIPQVESINSPSDTLEPAGTLNESEQSQAGGHYLIEVTSSKDGQATLVINGNNGPTQAVTAGNPASFEVQLPNGAASIHAIVKDSVGNVSAGPPNTVIYTPIVDAAAPSLSFDQPTGSEPLLAGASLDVRLSCDEVGGEVTLSDNGASVGTATVASDQTVTFDDANFGILSDGTHVLTASISDAAGNTTFAGPLVVTVDTTPPSLTLVQPSAQVGLTDGDDADPSSGGYQLAVVASTSGDAATWMAQLASNCDSGFGSCNTSAMVIPSTAITSPEGTEPTQLITIPVYKSPDYLVLTVTVMDAAGNKDVQTSQITITLSTCSATLVGLPTSGYIGNSLCPTPGSDCADVDIDFTVSLVGACGDVQSVDLERNGLVVASSPVTEGEASFSQNFAHGSQPPALEGKTVGGTGASTGSQTFYVDLADPVPVFSAKTFSNPSGPDFTSPASGSTATFNATHDQSSAQADLQIHLRLDVTDDGMGNGSVTQLEVNDGTNTTAVSTSPALPQALTGTSTGLDLLNATLPDGANHTVTAQVQDEAGNSAETSFTYTSDIVAPDAVTINATVDHARTPAVTLSWAAPSDNNDPATPATTYEVRYSRSPITEANFGNACDATNLLTATALPTPSTAGTVDSYTVTGPDARDPNYTENGQDCKFVVLPSAGTYYFAARAGDAAGNWGPMGSDSTASLALRAAKFGISGNLASSNFDTRVSNIGDINNDGFSDFLVGGNTTHGFCIFYGSDSATIADTIVDPETGLSGSNYQCMLDNLGPSAVTSYAGYEAQNIGDFNDDGLQDFAVPLGKNSKGIDNAVRIYLGVNGGQVDSTPAMTINGFEEASLQARFNGGGDFNGDGIPDLVIGSRTNSESFIIPGQSGLDVNTPINCDVSSAADRNTFQVVTVRMIGGTSVQFGAYQDFVGNILTDAGADQYDDVVIGAYGASGGTALDSRALVIKGRASASGETIIDVSYDHDGSQAEDAQSVLLMADSGKNNFPSDGITRSDLNGDGIVDIVLEHGKNSPAQTLYLFNGASIQNSVGGTLQVNASAEEPVGDETYISPDGNGIVWKGTYNYCASLGNFDGDPEDSHASIDYACRNYYSAGYGIAYIRLNTNNPDAGLPYGTYPYVDIELTDPFNPASLSFGTRDVQGLADFNGDGLIDVVVATKNSGYSVLFY